MDPAHYSDQYMTEEEAIAKIEKNKKLDSRRVSSATATAAAAPTPANANATTALASSSSICTTPRSGGGRFSRPSGESR